MCVLNLEGKNENAKIAIFSMPLSYLKVCGVYALGAGCVVCVMCFWAQ